MADAGEMRPYLMSPAREQLDLNEAQAAVLGEDGVLCAYLLCALGAALADGDLVFLLILGEPALEHAALLLHGAVDNAEIIFLQLPVLELLVEYTQALGVLSGDDYAPGVAVDAVDERRGEGLLVPWVVFAFLIEIALDPCDERVVILRVVRVREQADLFVEQQDILILIDDIELL